MGTNLDSFVAASPIFLAGGGMVECGNSRTNKRDPITIERLTRRFANRFDDSGHGEGSGSKGIVCIYIYIYLGSRRAEVAGQLISHFFDEDSRNSRCVPFAAIQVVITGLLRIAPPTTTRAHWEENRTSKKGNEVESNKTGVQAGRPSGPAKFHWKRDQISFIIYTRDTRNNETTM